MPVITGRDGGMHPVFAAAIERKRMPQDDQRIIAAAPVPGSVPATTRPPRSEDVTASTPEGPSVIPATATPASRPGIFARWFGGTEVKSAPAGARTGRRADAATPSADRRRAAAQAAAAPAEEKDKPAAPALMPGSTPIVSSGGFSFR